MNKTKTTITVLIILLVLAFSYIGVDKYVQYQQQKELGAFQQGAEYGYEQAIAQLVQQAATCQQVPVNYYNQTVSVIAVDCLQTS